MAVENIHVERGRRRSVLSALIIAAVATVSPVMGSALDTAGTGSAPDSASGFRFVPRQVKAVIVFQDWSAKTKEDEEDLRYFLRKLFDMVDRVPRLAARVPASAGTATGKRYICSGSLTSRSELAQIMDKEQMHYTLMASVTLTDPETQAIPLSTTIECEQLDYKRTEDGTYDPKVGKLTDRDIVLLGCAERIAKDASRQIANVFPLTGSLRAGSDGQQLVVDLGSKDGIEKGMKFRVLRSESVVTADGQTIAKPPVDVGEIQITAIGDGRSEFKVLRVARDAQLRIGDITELKPKEKTFLQKMTDKMNESTKALK